MASYPFLTTAFLDALEQSGAASPAQGWRPLHIERDDVFVPLYLRNQSWGEFVFDQNWALASQRAGIPWFPRLVTAVPFTPVAGPRWRGGPAAADLWRDVENRLESTGAHSWNLLFPDDDTRDALSELDLIERRACHFRWHNPGYAHFDDFLAALTSRRRKMIRKERAQVAAHGLRIEWRTGRDIPAGWWPPFWQCYAMTYYERGQAPYLPPGFFTRLAASPLRDQLALVAAFEGDTMTAAAFYLFDDNSLYGRYWGSLRALDGLHFELCYYRGMEFCMERGLRRFDPGVQGEHKILRGFEPEITWSLHWLRHPRLREAVARFCVEEGKAVERYREDARELLPYRSD